jgi:hypothetical protein
VKLRSTEGIEPRRTRRERTDPDSAEAAGVFRFEASSRTGCCARPKANASFAFKPEAAKRYTPPHDRFGRACSQVKNSYVQMRARLSPLLHFSASPLPRDVPPHFPLVIVPLFPYTIPTATPRTNDKQVGAGDELFECGEAGMSATGAGVGEPTKRQASELSMVSSEFGEFGDRTRPGSRARLLTHEAQCTVRNISTRQRALRPVESHNRGRFRHPRRRGLDSGFAGPYPS